jgi:hypothetical protein
MGTLDLRTILNGNQRIVSIDSKNAYNKGKAIKVSIVDVINPPITTVAKGR